MGPVPHGYDEDMPRPAPTSSPSSPLRVGMLSTTPPTSCGIATFASALASGLRHHDSNVVHVDAGPRLLTGSSAVCALGAGDPGEVAAVASILNGCDVSIVQHEYGIYPGRDGAGVLDVVRAVDGPIIVVAHTVLSAPSASQRQIMIELHEAADMIVVMTEVALQRLIHHYGLSQHRIMVIPHGAAVAASSMRDARTETESPRLLTWGLLGPGKGIEWAIDAFAQLAVDGPQPHYLIAGATHPNVKARHGEEYRDSLVDRAERLGVGDRVVFDDTYRSVSELTELICTADLVVLPYDSAEQVTSGVLVDAVAAGRPVVSTAFPHAVELLASGAGVVVPQRDAAALADAIEHVLNNSDVSTAMAAEARRLAPSLSWPAVAGRYVDAAVQLRNAGRALAS